MALNATDPSDPAVVEYRLWNNRHVVAGETVDKIIGDVAVVAAGAPGGRLAVLVINCHGYYNNLSRSGQGGFGLAIGEGIYRWHTGKFTALNGLVTNIIITACGTARITTPGAAPTANGDGNLFCSEISRNSGAYVIAGTTRQYHENVPNDYIDDFEGLVLRYNPADGKPDWSHDYGQSLREGLWYGWN
jgi:hypothetical protein